MAQRTTSRLVTVLIVDDQAAFRAVAREVIEATPGFSIVGEAAGGTQAFDEVDRLAPQLVLLDVRMRGLSGIDVARRLLVTHPETVVVLISIADRTDLPSLGDLSCAVPFIRKQDFSPRALRRVWREHAETGQEV